MRKNLLALFLAGLCSVLLLQSAVAQDVHVLPPPGAPDTLPRMLAQDMEFIEEENNCLADGVAFNTSCNTVDSQKRPVAVSEIIPLNKGESATCSGDNIQLYEVKPSGEEVLLYTFPPEMIIKVTAVTIVSNYDGFKVRAVLPSSGFCGLVNTMGKREWTDNDAMLLQGVRVYQVVSATNDSNRYGVGTEASDKVLPNCVRWEPGVDFTPSRDCTYTKVVTLMVDNTGAVILLAMGLYSDIGFDPAPAEGNSAFSVSPSTYYTDAMPTATPMPTATVIPTSVPATWTPAPTLPAPEATAEVTQSAG